MSSGGLDLSHRPLTAKGERGMFEAMIIFRKDVERAEEIRAFAEEKGWSEEELEGAVNALRPDECDVFQWN